MSDHSAIAWTDATWNPVTGCTKVSEGCRNCYAERMAMRRMSPEWHWHENNRPRRFTDVRCHEDRLDQPLKWRKPRRVFVCSMGDLFHPDVPDRFIDKVFAVMARCPEHVFQILTKRPERMRTFVMTWDPQDLAPLPMPNVWLGTSVEDRTTADVRIPVLLQTPAVVKFISAEPLLEDIADNEVFSSCFYSGFTEAPQRDVVNWVIVGGESGPKARPCDLAWIRSIVQQCKAAGVPCFVKQVGSRPSGWWTNELGPGFNRHALTNREGADPVEWPEDLRVRQFPGGHT